MCFENSALAFWNVGIEQPANVSQLILNEGADLGGLGRYRIRLRSEKPLTYMARPLNQPGCTKRFTIDGLRNSMECRPENAVDRLTLHRPGKRSEVAF
jgi:hypothetical protein